PTRPRTGSTRSRSCWFPPGGALWSTEAHACDRRRPHPPRMTQRQPHAGHRRAMRTWAAGLVALAAGAALVACGSDTGSGSTAASTAEVTSSTPDVCASADALRGSLAGLADVQVVQQGTDALQQSWT